MADKALADHTVAELDELAVAHDVGDYPVSGNKTDKIAALEAAGIGPQPAERFALRIRHDFFEGKPAHSQAADSDVDVEHVVSFMADTKAVTLTGDEVFQTADRSLFYGLRELPFLEPVEG